MRVYILLLYTEKKRKRHHIPTYKNWWIYT